MGKGSTRRPEDTEAVRRNWPFPPKEPAREPEWWENQDVHLRAHEELQRRIRAERDAERDKLISERLDGTRPDCIYECGTWEECDGECVQGVAAGQPNQNDG